MSIRRPEGRMGGDASRFLPSLQTMEAVPLGVTSPATSTAIPAPTYQEVPKVLACTVQESPHPCPTHLPPQFYHLLLLSFQTRVGGSCCFLFPYLCVPHLPLFTFWPHLAACGILAPQQGVETRSLAVKTRSPNHWVLGKSFFILSFFFFFFFLEAVPLFELFWTRCIIFHIDSTMKKLVFSVLLPR